MDDNPNEGNTGGIRLSINDKITVVTYKCKTVQNLLTEIAGLLVLFRVFTLILSSFHEQRFISKMKKETKEEFREVFTYQNFKRLIVENKEMKEEMREIKEFINFRKTEEEVKTD